MYVIYIHTRIQRYVLIKVIIFYLIHCGCLRKTFETIFFETFKKYPT